jgi:hypothetical protein
MMDEGNDRLRRLSHAINLTIHSSLKAERDQGQKIEN